jgi:5-methylcytosine-specific restriction endonuclease McrA
MNNTDIPCGKLCDSGCGQPAQYFSKGTGRYRCAKSANSCPANKEKNSVGLKKAHAEGRIPVFTDEMRKNSHISHRRKLVEEKPFEKLGHRLRKKIVMEEQDYKCSHCGLDEWMGLRITLELDHIDGNNQNNVRSNLRCLCPNCHSITDTWKVGQREGKQVRKCSDEEIIAAYKNNSSMNATLKELGYNWGSASTVKKVLFQYKLIDSI